MDKFHEVFPLKTFKVREDDKPWYSPELKNLDRRKKREFDKNHKSERWFALQREYKNALKTQKEKYYKNMVKDLKQSNPRNWYSKIKRMSGKEQEKGNVDVEEIQDLPVHEQVSKIAEFYSSTRNQYPPVEEDDFDEFSNADPSDLFINPTKIPEVIKKMNKNSATILGIYL